MGNGLIARVEHLAPGVALGAAVGVGYRVDKGQGIVGALAREGYEAGVLATPIVIGALLAHTVVALDTRSDCGAVDADEFAKLLERVSTDDPAIRDFLVQVLTKGIVGAEATGTCLLVPNHPRVVGEGHVRPCPVEERLPMA